MLKRKSSSISPKPKTPLTPKTKSKIAQSAATSMPEAKGSVSQATIYMKAPEVKEEALAPAESLTPQEMSEELRELQLLTVSEDQTGLTKARLRRAIKIVYLLNQSKTGPKEKTPRKGKTKEGPINLDTLPEGADPYDTL